jgi:hypothetical protein
MDAGAEQSLTARTFPPKLLVGRRFVSSQLRQTPNDGGLRFYSLQGEGPKLTSETAMGGEKSPMASTRDRRNADEAAIRARCYRAEWKANLACYERKI